MAEKKHSAFALLAILKEETDEDHILTAGELTRRLYDEYGLSIERRTLYSNMEILRQAGYEISDYNDNGTGYYLMTRQFDKSEVLFLCNAIHASHYISSRQSDDLINKLLNTLSRPQQKEFRNSVYLPNRQKTNRKELFYNIDVISEAIQKQQAVQFSYMHYDKNKKLVARREEPYVADPRYIVYADSRPYMIATASGHPDFIHYRLDRIRNPKILAEASTRLSRVQMQEAYQYASSKLFMFTGQTIRVSFLCKSLIMDQIVDIFGPDVQTIPQADEAFIASVETTESGALFLAQQYLDAMEIIAPQSVRDKMRKQLKTSLALYRHTPGE